MSQGSELGYWRLMVIHSIEKFLKPIFNFLIFKHEVASQILQEFTGFSVRDSAYSEETYMPVE